MIIMHGVKRSPASRCDAVSPIFISIVEKRSQGSLDFWTGAGKAKLSGLTKKAKSIPSSLSPCPGSFLLFFLSLSPNRKAKGRKGMERQGKWCLFRSMSASTFSFKMILVSCSSCDTTNIGLNLERPSCGGGVVPSPALLIPGASPILFRFPHSRMRSPTVGMAWDAVNALADVEGATSGKLDLERTWCSGEM
ncbi:hypothetical protein MPTK1_2g20800 [Marchantia polymorpha subsp. ruderalis]|nr:hypothetical protein MARPO_0040s0132 [Marchantia polymorpha]BBN03105.1 hypothetical protein Mp_2g20800 [Marchantia polymorpha subsp. ruderalis]|eukprot:PTQ40470.1 hypothetical protein MARPO_0040s0132 [Marchantia polymorpha]